MQYYEKIMFSFRILSIGHVQSSGTHRDDAAVFCRINSMQFIVRFHFAFAANIGRISASKACNLAEQNIDLPNLL